MCLVLEMEFSTEWDSEELASYLTEKGLHEDVVANIISNRITSGLFLDLEESDLKELAPAIGDRVTLRKILDEERKGREQPSPQGDNQCSQRGGTSRPSKRNSNTSVTDSVIPSNSDGCPGPSNDNSSDWHILFSIPELRNFSQHVKDTVNTGVVTARARREINQVLRTYMTAHTIYPTSEQYTTICKKLIAKYPNLKDTQGKTKYSSWKLGLRNSFKNFRRGYLKENDKSAPPPSKRLKLYDTDEPDISQEEYDEAVRELQEVYRSRGKGKKGSQHSLVKGLMEKTKVRRYQWIQQEHPLVSEITEKFPHLTSSRWVRREFKAIASFEDDFHSMIDGWLDWREKLIQLAKLESTTRPMIKKLLEALEECDKLPYPQDGSDVICLHLLLRMLHPRGLGKNSVFLKCIESCEVDVDEEVIEIAQSEPFILVTGKPGMETSQTFICCEGQIFAESKSMKDALFDLIAVYFIFDIAYPKTLSNILLFLQHHVFNLKDEQTAPSTVKTLVANLEKL